MSVKFVSTDGMCLCQPYSAQLCHISRTIIPAKLTRDTSTADNGYLSLCANIRNQNNTSSQANTWRIYCRQLLSLSLSLPLFETRTILPAKLTGDTSTADNAYLPLSLSATIRNQNNTSSQANRWHIYCRHWLSLSATIRNQNNTSSQANTRRIYCR